MDFDNNQLINITYIHFLLKEKLVPDFKDVDFSSTQGTEIRREIYEFLKEEPTLISQLLNKENIDELKNMCSLILLKILRILQMIYRTIFSKNIMMIS